MKEVTVNDGLRSRRRSSKILVGCTNGIFEFKGVTVPNAVRVLKKEYEKNGVWSKNVWTLGVEDGFQVITHVQDFGTGKYFNEESWSSVFSTVRSWFNDDIANALTEEKIKAFMATVFTPTFNKLNDNEREYSVVNGSALILAEQQKLYEAHLQLKKEKEKIVEEIKFLETEAEVKRIQAQTKHLQDILKDGKMSLADLKALL